MPVCFCCWVISPSLTWELKNRGLSKESWVDNRFIWRPSSDAPPSCSSFHFRVFGLSLTFKTNRDWSVNSRQLSISLSHLSLQRRVRKFTYVFRLRSSPLVPIQQKLTKKTRAQMIRSKLGLYKEAKWIVFLFFSLLGDQKIRPPITRTDDKRKASSIQLYFLSMTLHHTDHIISVNTRPTFSFSFSPPPPRSEHQSQAWHPHKCSLSAPLHRKCFLHVRGTADEDPRPRKTCTRPPPAGPPAKTQSWLSFPPKCSDAHVHRLEGSRWGGQSNT